MAEGNGNGNGGKDIWKILTGFTVIIGILGSTFSAGMNYARNADNSAAIDDIRTDLQANYSRRGEVDLRFGALQQQLSRIEAAVNRNLP